MGRKKKGSILDSMINNQESYSQYFNRLLELSISMFEWKNLPTEIDPRYLELQLFEKGQAVFFKDVNLDIEHPYVALGSSGGVELDIYGNPKKRQAIAINGYTKQLDETDSVIIYNNMIRTPSVMDVVIFARKLYELDQIISVNAKAQKTPVLIRCDESQRMTLLNLYEQYEGNAPMIAAGKQLNPNDLTVLSTGAPYVCDKLYELKTQIWNEALTYLGISNLSINKKERLITDEVNRNQGGTIASRYSRLETRKQAARKINEMFDLNIEVEYREDYSTEGEPEEGEEFE